MAGGRTGTDAPLPLLFRTMATYSQDGLSALWGQFRALASRVPPALAAAPRPQAHPSAELPCAWGSGQRPGPHQGGAAATLSRVKAEVTRGSHVTAPRDLPDRSQRPLQPVAAQSQAIPGGAAEFLVPLSCPAQKCGACRLRLGMCEIRDWAVRPQLGREPAQKGRGPAARRRAWLAARPHGRPHLPWPWFPHLSNGENCPENCPGSGPWRGGGYLSPGGLSW